MMSVHLFVGWSYTHFTYWEKFFWQSRSAWSALNEWIISICSSSWLSWLVCRFVGKVRGSNLINNRCFFARFWQFLQIFTKNLNFPLPESSIGFEFLSAWKCASIGHEYISYFLRWEYTQNQLLSHHDKLLRAIKSLILPVYSKSLTLDRRI